MVEDITGRGRTVFYAFVRTETGPLLDRMMATFVDFVDSIAATGCVILDKDQNEIAAVRAHLPEADVLLCTFHVLKSFKAKIAELPKTVGEKEEIFRCVRGILYASGDAFQSKIENVSSGGGETKKPDTYRCVLFSVKRCEQRYL